MLTSHERTTWPFFFLPCVLAATGCDGMYTTYQAIEVNITDVESGGPVGNATVEVSGRYHHYWHPDMTESARNNKWFDETQSKRHSTNEAGHSAFEHEICTISGGLFPGVFPGFDPEKDRVTGAPYLFRVTKGELQEVLTVLMRPGNVGRGTRFAVKVLSIGDPTSVSSEEGGPAKSANPTK